MGANDPKTLKDRAKEAYQEVAEAAEPVIKGIAGIAGEAAYSSFDALDGKIIDTTNSFKDWAKIGYASIVKTTVSLDALAKTLEYIPYVGELTSEQFKQMSEGFKALNNVTETERKLLEGISDLMVGKVGNAFNTYAGVLATSAKNAQDFQVEMVKLGQGTDVIAGLRAQANALAQYGISYKELKDVSKFVIESFQGSIRLTEEQTNKFEKNRLAMQEQISFNKKFDIAHEDSIKVLNYFNNTTEEGTKNFEGLSGGLQRFAQETGQKTSKVFKDFSESLDRFAFKSAPEAANAFAKLEAFAKRTGQETKSVISSLAEFDDFTSGYEKVGKLNRVLMQFGSSVDPMRFMEASDEEKQRMLVEAVSRASTGFGGVQSEKAKRLIASNISELSKIPFENTVSLLKGITGSKEDLLGALEKSAGAQPLTGEEKRKIGKELTTSKEAGELRDALIETTNAVQKLAAGMRESDFTKIKQVGGIINKLDADVFNAVVDKNFNKLGSASRDAIKRTGDEIAALIKDVGSAQVTNIIQRTGDSVAAIVDQLGRNPNKIYVQPDNTPGASAMQGRVPGNTTAGKSRKR